MSNNENLILLACSGYINMIQKLLFSKLLQRRKRSIRNGQIFIEKITQKINNNCAIYLNKIISMQRNESINILKPKKRKFWTKTTNNWRVTTSKICDEQMIEDYRMNKDSFQYICKKLSPELSSQAGSVGEILSVDMKVAIALYKLGSDYNYSVVGKKFGVHKSSIKRCLYKFCNAMIKVFSNEEIKIPTSTEALKKIKNFEDKCGIPSILAGINSTHIPITDLSTTYSNYINQRGWASIVFQGVVDSNNMFIDITCKHPGSVDDAKVLMDSFLSKNITELNLPKQTIDGAQIPSLIVGNSAYPLLPWLIKEYSGSLSAEEESFNTQLKKVKIVTQNAFKRLKGRWKILQKGIENDINFTPSIIATCCILHNILERKKSPYVDTWNNSVENTNTILVQPSYQNEEFCTEGEKFRNHLKKYMTKKVCENLKI